MGITVLGVNHRTAPLEVRERFAYGPREVPMSLERVLAAGSRGGVLLSTCNRTEFYLADPNDAVPNAVWTLLSERLGGGRHASEYGYSQRGRDAARHLYRVSAGIDSVILRGAQNQGAGGGGGGGAENHPGPPPPPPLPSPPPAGRRGPP